MSSEAEPILVEEFNAKFIAALMQAPSDALVVASHAAKNFTRGRLLEGYVMWGDTAELYRHVTRNLCSDDAFDAQAYSRLRRLQDDSVECISKGDYVLWLAQTATGKDGGPCPIPEDALEGNRIES